MKRIKKIGVPSFVKLLTVFGAFIGLILGIIYSVGGFFLDLSVTLEWVSSEWAETPGLSEGTLLAFGALVGMPIIFAVIGFLIGVIAAPLYNLAAKFTGGIEVEIGK